MSSEIQKFQIVLIRPNGYIHTDAFMEIAETMLHAFRQLCCIATLSENNFSDSAINIVLGANLLTESDIQYIPNNTVIYNLEQLSEDSPWMTSTLITLFKKFEVWDYSLRNIELIKKMGMTNNIFHLPIGYVDSMTRIEPAETQDIDVLFYGSINPRREKIINELKQAGLIVEALCGVYGKTRDEYIARA